MLELASSSVYINCGGLLISLKPCISPLATSPSPLLLIGIGVGNLVNISNIATPTLNVWSGISLTKNRSNLFSQYGSFGRKEFCPLNCFFCSTFLLNHSLTPFSVIDDFLLYIFVCSGNGAETRATIINVVYYIIFLRIFILLKAILFFQVALIQLMFLRFFHALIFHPSDKRVRIHTCMFYCICLPVCLEFSPCLSCSSSACIIWCILCVLVDTASYMLGLLVYVYEHIPLSYMQLSLCCLCCILGISVYICLYSLRNIVCAFFLLLAC